MLILYKFFQSYLRQQIKQKTNSNFQLSPFVSNKKFNIKQKLPPVRMSSTFSGLKYFRKKAQFPTFRIINMEIRTLVANRIFKNNNGTLRRVGGQLIHINYSFDPKTFQME